MVLGSSPVAVTSREIELWKEETKKKNNMPDIQMISLVHWQFLLMHGYREQIRGLNQYIKALFSDPFLVEKEITV